MSGNRKWPVMYEVRVRVQNDTYQPVNQQEHFLVAARKGFCFVGTGLEPHTRGSNLQLERVYL